MKSPSAFSTHSAVSAFIQCVPLLHNLSDEKIAFLQSISDLPGSPHKQIDWEGRVNRSPDFDGLGRHIITTRHHHKQVDIGVGPGRPIGVGSKQNNACGPELFRNSAS